MPHRPKNHRTYMVVVYLASDHQVGSDIIEDLTKKEYAKIAAEVDKRVTQDASEFFMLSTIVRAKHRDPMHMTWETRYTLKVTVEIES